MRPAAEPSSSPLLRWWPLAVMLAAAAVAYGLGVHRYVSIEALVSHRAALKASIASHPVLAFAGFAGIYMVAVAFAFPIAALLTIAGGFLFGWFWGALGAMLGATAGAMVLFLAARTALGDMLRRRAGAAMTRIVEGFQDDAASYLLFLRLVPVFPFFIVNLAAAAMRAPVSTFAWTTLLGIAPATTAYALAGAGLDSILAAQTAAFDACVAGGGTGCKITFSPKSLLTPVMLAALAALGVIALIPVAIRRLRGQRAAQSEER
ncbi:MAG: TVP38/TMEM64 family protein [Beijerinckiaceae bacterium]